MQIDKIEWRRYTPLALILLTRLAFWNKWYLLLLAEKGRDVGFDEGWLISIYQNARSLWNKISKNCTCQKFPGAKDQALDDLIRQLYWIKYAKNIWFWIKQVNMPLACLSQKTGLSLEGGCRRPINCFFFRQTLEGIRPARQCRVWPRRLTWEEGQQTSNCLFFSWHWRASGLCSNNLDNNVPAAPYQRYWRFASSTTQHT